MDHEDHLVVMMAHSYTPLLLLEGGAFCRMVTHIDPYILPITWSKFTSTVIPHKL